MGTGLALGRIFPGLNDALDEIKIDSTSLPIAIGLRITSYNVCYTKLLRSFRGYRDRRQGIERYRVS